MSQEWSFRFFVSITWPSETDLDCAVLRIFPVIIEIRRRLKLLSFGLFEILLSENQIVNDFKLVKFYSLFKHANNFVTV